MFRTARVGGRRRLANLRQQATVVVELRNDAMPRIRTADVCRAQAAGRLEALGALEPMPDAASPQQEARAVRAKHGMAIVGAVLLMARYKAINLKFVENWEEEYRTGEQVEADHAPGLGEKIDDEPEAPHKISPEEEAKAAKIRMEKLIGRRTTSTKESTPPAKKS